MTPRSPRVSICLPVFNGARHVRAAIESILLQSFDDFELVISDNASTDGTREICLAATEQDDRVHYCRAEINRGLAWNFNHAFKQARGNYLAWIGHDDIMARSYIQRCVEALDRSPECVLCFSNANYIDDTGLVITPVELQNPGESKFPSDRFAKILYDDLCDPICGVMRTEVLLQTRLHGPYADSDRVLLAELGMRGQFCFLPDRLYSRRMHELQTTALYNDRWERSLVFDPSKAGRPIYPWIRELTDLITTVHKAPISRKEAYQCYKRLYWWSSVHRKFLLDDLRRGIVLLTEKATARFTNGLRTVHGG